MQFPIMLSMPAQENLRSSAMAFRQGRSAPEVLAKARMPRGVTLDLSFPAVPIGTGLSFESAVSVSPERSERFVVRASIDAERSEDVPEEINGAQVFADPVIEPFRVRGANCGGPPIGNASDVQRLLNSAALSAKRLNGDNVAIAIVDTGINLSHLNGKLGAGVRLDVANSWRPPGSTTLAGRSPVDHGTMCAYNALLIAPNATLIDVPVLSARAPGGSGMSGTLSVALQAYAALLANWSVAFAPGGLGQYSALVISNSWGMYHPSWDLPAGHRGRFCDNPKHSFNLLVSSMVAAGADVVFAAGNCGADCPDGRCEGRTSGAIMGSSAHAEVLCVAGCDTTDVRVGYSSQGPSIAGMPPDKPDLTGYAHFLGSEVFGAGYPDTGTSTACPIVSGCVAAIRTRLLPARTTPVALASQLRATARQVVGGPGTRNDDYGFGIIDALATANSLGL